eukprot:Ihof_evm5s56 gene=Ihof_evmTU5s56
MKSQIELDLEQGLLRWEKADLVQQQQDIDVEFHEMARRVGESEKSRKQLVAITRESRRQMTEEVRKALGPILRAYQQEVDSLSKRCKATESAYLKLYNALSDVPDPVPIMKGCLEELEKNDSTEENEVLKEKLAMYQEEMTLVKNQDITINSLRAKLREYEASATNSIEEAVKVKKEDMEVVHAEQMAELQDRCDTTQRQLNTAEQQVAELLAARENEQRILFEARSRYEEELASLNAQMELVTTEADRHAQELLDMKKQRDNALTLLDQQKQNVIVPQSEEDSSETMVTTLNNEIAAKEKEISNLIADCQRLHAQITTQQQSHTATIEDLEEHIRDCENEIGALQSKMEEVKDYDTIKRELDILKMVEFKTNTAAENQTNESLEVLLLEKNKNLNVLVTDLNIKMASSDQLIAKLQSENDRLVKALHDKSQLADTLELVRETSLAPNSQENMLRRSLSNHTALGSPDNITTDGEVAITIGANESSSNLSMLEIITNQRDRFRDRLESLRADNTQLQQTINQLTNEVGEVRSDNVKLYEKIKFLQSYPAQVNSSHKERNVDDVEKKYSTQYEEQMNPFNQFHQKVQRNRYAGLSTAEKATLGMTQFIVSSKTTRKFIFFYTILLHALVIVVLYAY